ncbi:MAG: hypothetical protein ACW991_04970 [Candidatus Hodarchaeales archaeon]
MKLRTVSFDESVKFDQERSSISYSFQLATTGEPASPTTLIMHFIGEYRYGSAGNPDARHLIDIIKTAIGTWPPDSLIIDLSKLNYEWGDYIEGVLDFANYLPTAFIVGSKCREGLSMLVFGIYTKKDVTEAEDFFENILEAFEYLQKTYQNEPKLSTSRIWRRIL